ncbi:hypothetical protein ACFVT5_34480 [Streptomyces sp. NPDC058001]|uniref:hypothetical protein n=1 Tax=Streptomyces sp. NPDC058001 TaxID=3346300 RepID=UPI0036EB9745
MPRFPTLLPRPSTPVDETPPAPPRPPAPPASSTAPSSAPVPGPTPPPPSPSARFPDLPPPARRPAADAAPPRPVVAPRRPTDDRVTDRLTGRPVGRPSPTPPSGTPLTAPPPVRPAARPFRRPVGSVDLTPGPGAGRPFVTFAPPETGPGAPTDDDTTRLRPIGPRVRPRAAAAAACVVLGLGLIGGAVTGSWLTGDSTAASDTRNAYAAADSLWHSTPVDQLFPPVLKGEGAGPGGADRTWTRIAVAPDSTCEKAFDPLLRKALDPAGCLRLLRATYTDATRSHVTTVGLLFTKADADGMRTLRERFADEGLDRRKDLMPRPYAAKGTVAEGFGDEQRASWTLSVLTDVPVVVYAISGFADGRTVTDPQPADDAMKAGAGTAPAQAGLGHEAQGIADRVERGLRKTVAAATEKHT